MWNLEIIETQIDGGKTCVLSRNCVQSVHALSPKRSRFYLEGKQSERNSNNKLTHF